MGGAVSFQMAVSHPDIVDKLIIVNSGPDFDNMGKIGAELLQSRTVFLKTKGLQELAKEISKNMFPEPQQQKLREDFEERCGKNSPEVYYKTFVTLMEWGLGDKLETIPHKTLIVGSDMDYMSISHKEEYASRMQNASVAIVSNSRHGVVMDQYDVFNKVIFVLSGEQHFDIHAIEDLRSHVEGSSQEVVLHHSLSFHNRKTPDTWNTTIDRLRNDVAAFVIFG